MSTMAVLRSLPGLCPQAGNMHPWRKMLNREFLALTRGSARCLRTAKKRRALPYGREGLGADRHRLGADRPRLGADRHRLGVDEHEGDDAWLIAAIDPIVDRPAL